MLVNWKLLAGLGIAVAGAAGILYYREKIVGGAAGAAYTAGQAVGAIPSGLAGGINDGLNPIRQILGQPTVNPPTYQYRTPQFLAPEPSPLLQQQAPPLPTPAMQVVAPAPQFNYKPNPSSKSTRSYAASRNSKYVAGSTPQTLVSQRTNPRTGRVETKVSTSPISAYYAGTKVARSTIHFSPTNKVTTQLSKAAIDTYKKYGVKVTPA